MTISCGTPRSHVYVRLDWMCCVNNWMSLQSYLTECQRVLIHYNFTSYVSLRGKHWFCLTTLAEVTFIIIWNVYRCQHPARWLPARALMVAFGLLNDTQSCELLKERPLFVKYSYLDLKKVSYWPPISGSTTKHLADEIPRFSYMLLIPFDSIPALLQD